jgi:condensin complex subunit 3
VASASLKPPSPNTNNLAEEEKKHLAPLLAKLHISPTSTESLIRDIYQEVSIAIEDKLISDTTGRNALYKIHVSLGKIVNSLTEKEPKERKSSAPLVEDKAVLGDEEEGEEETDILKVEEDDEGTVLGNADADESKLTRDSLVEDLLSDEDVTMT